MDPYPKTRDGILLKPGCLQYKDKDKGEKGLKIKIKGTNPFQIRIFDDLLPKLSRVLKIKSLNA